MLSHIISQPNLRRLITHRALTLLSESFISGFGIIFVYQVSGEQIMVPIVILALANLVSLLMCPLSGFVFNRIGTKYSLLIGVLFRIVLWSSLLMATPDNWPITLALYAVSIVLVRWWYWPAYNNAINLETTTENRTSTLAVLSNCANAFSLFMPIIVGYVITQAGFTWPLLFGTIGIVISLIPLLGLNPTPVTFDWNAREVWSEFFKTKNRTYIITEASNGFESVFTAVLWPIVIYLLLSGDFVSIGLITSATTLVVIIVNYITGRLGDSFGKNRTILKYATLLHAASWMGRALVESALQIFAIRSFARVSGSITTLSMQSLSFTYAGQDRGHSDEMMIIREMALNTGRTLAYVLMGVLSFFVPIQWLFVLAALSVLLLNLIPETGS